GNGEAYRQRVPRREDSRVIAQEGRSRGVSGPVGDQQLLRGTRTEVQERKVVEAQEEGEIKAVEVSNQQLPSQTFQEELAKTQATGTKVISDAMDAERGIQVIQGLVGNKPAINEDKTMEMDEIREVFLANGIDMDAVDDLQECSEREMEEAMRELDRAGEEDFQEDEALVLAEDDKVMAEDELAKKHGIRKRLLKPVEGTAVSTKMRIANALASPRKRTGAKTGTRQGEINKQLDTKGTGKYGSQCAGEKWFFRCMGALVGSIGKRKNGNGRDVCTLAGTRENWADVLVAFRVMVQCGVSFTNWVSVGEASGDH
ncbi:unnamed protein product, partial [Brassica rapa subsp. trilocularis]